MTRGLQPCNLATLQHCGRRSRCCSSPEPPWPAALQLALPASLNGPTLQRHLLQFLLPASQQAAGPAANAAFAAVQRRQSGNLSGGPALAVRLRLHFQRQLPITTCSPSSTSAGVLRQLGQTACTITRVLGLEVSSQPPGHLPGGANALGVCAPAKSCGTI